MSPAKWWSEASVILGRLAVSLSHTAPDVSVKSILPYVMGSPVLVEGYRTKSGAVILTCRIGSILLERRRTVANKPDQSQTKRAAMRLVENTTGEFCFNRSLGG